MISDVKKEIILPPVNVTRTFDITTVAGRDDIADQIETDINAYCQQKYDAGPRSHLGASVIGHECEAYIWFHFRWMHIEKFSGRMQRLFNRGHKEEDRVFEWLRGIGFDVKSVDKDGKQIRIASVGNHFGGSCDGISSLPVRYGITACFGDRNDLLIEVKTSNGKQFQLLDSSGVVKQKPRHWSQMCVYGVKLNLHYALYICVNKDDDDLDVEVLELDWSLGEAEIAKAETIINLPAVPRKIAGHGASLFTCKFCSMNGICHLNEPLDRNCRSCQYAQPVENGEWKCHKFVQIIPKEFILKGCDEWQGMNR